MLKVSVIMTVYNTKTFLSEAIESILKQTFHDFEFIILDDFSTDGSYEILLNYAKKDTRIKLFRNQKNMGISYSRNKAIELSTTNLIATQDSDDISDSNRLDLEYDFLTHNPDYAVVSGDNIIIDETSKIIGKRIYSDDIKNTILKKSPLSNPASMFRKDIFLHLGGYETGLDYAEDYDLWLKIYLNGYKIQVLHYFLVKLRIRKGQTKSQRLKQTLKNTIKLQKKYIKLGLKPSLGDRIYIFGEHILLFLPRILVLFLFSFLSYRHED